MGAPDGSMVHGSTANAANAARPADPDAAAAARPADLPSIDRLLRQPLPAALLAEHGHTLVADRARELIDGLRRQALAGTLPAAALQPAALASALAARVAERLAPRLRAVLNLTGTVIHTNLGRSLLADAAIARLVATMASPNNLEFDLDSGGRGDRDGVVEELLCTLTGAEAATVVNNNAAAVLLTIGALAASHSAGPSGGREVIVSRGELVEIGGAFRMPDVMAAAGATLVEVGTTNRTHPHDYERAIGERTALLMKVHTSNYAVQGFTATVDEATLAGIAHARGLPLATDLGSGALVDLSRWGTPEAPLPREPLPQDMLAAGCDVVTFSGDKLLGGPQAGLIVGSRAAIGRIRRYPLKRALRISKLPLAALEATLRLYLRPERLARDLPTLRLLTRPLAAIQALAEALAPALAAALQPRYGVAAVPLFGQIGSGSLPIERLPSAGLALTPLAGSPSAAASARASGPGPGPAALGGGRRRGVGSALDELSQALRALPVPVIGRIADDRLLLDLRCLEDAAPFVAQLPALRERLGLPPRAAPRPPDGSPRPAAAGGAAAPRPSPPEVPPAPQPPAPAQPVHPGPPPGAASAGDPAAGDLSAGGPPAGDRPPASCPAIGR